MNDLNLRAWQARYREYAELVKGWSPRTGERYTAELKPFFAYLERQGVATLARLTRQHLEGYRLELHQLRYRNRPLTKSTLMLRLVAIKQFVRYLYRENYLLLDVAAGFELPRVGSGVPRTILSEREVVQLLEQPDTTTPLGVRDRTLLELLYGTAVRNTELRRLTLDQVDLERATLRIDHGKGEKARVVPLGEEALSWLEEYLAHVRPALVHHPSQQLVFPGQRGKELCLNHLIYIVRRRARQAGLDKNVTPHVLRHSCATHMLRRGANLRHLQKLLGHTSMDTTTRYTRVEVSDLARVLERCHPRECDLE